MKLENIVFDRQPSFKQTAPTPPEPKIIDFGLATRYLSDDYKKMNHRVGTLYSMAPEVIQAGKDLTYDSKCDLWSIGVITYMLLSKGQEPFWGPAREMSWEERRPITMDRILRGKYHILKTNVSNDAEDFCTTLLVLASRNALEEL